MYGEKGGNAMGEIKIQEVDKKGLLTAEAAGALVPLALVENLVGWVSLKMLA